MHITCALVILSFRLVFGLDCLDAPPFLRVTSRPKVSGLRIDRHASILFTPASNTSQVTVSFGLLAQESTLLFVVKLGESKSTYHLPANHDLANIFHHLTIHQKCSRLFIELVMIPQCELSKKIYFKSDSGGEFQYEIISYDILNPTIYKIHKKLILNTEIIECRAIDLNAPGYLILYSFPVFLQSSHPVRVPANVVSRINKTRAVYVITYRINNETIPIKNQMSSTVTIAYEASQRAHGVHFELSPVVRTPGISWMPQKPVQKIGSLLRFRYTFNRSKSQNLTAIEVHLTRLLTSRIGQKSLLMRVTHPDRGVTRGWHSFSLPSAHLAFRALRHLTSSMDGNLQTLEVGLIPDNSCHVPMVFQIMATGADDRQRRVESAFFESTSMHSIGLRWQHLKPVVHIHAKVHFCSSRLHDKPPPNILWNIEGFHRNWTSLPSVHVQSKQMDQFSIHLNLTFPVLIRCVAQNLSLSIANSQTFHVIISQVLPEKSCKPNIRWSVETAAGRQMSDLTWIQRHEPFALRLDAQFPHFLSAEALVKAKIPPQRHWLTFQRENFKSDGEILRLQQRWRQQLDNCNLFAEVYQGQIMDKGQPTASAKMLILPQFCKPRITEFKATSQSKAYGLLVVTCRIEAADLHDALPYGILDNGKSLETVIQEQPKSAMVLRATLFNFSSCEDLQLRKVICWLRKKELQVVFRTLMVPDEFCEGPMLYFLFLVCGVLPIIFLFYCIIALRECLHRRQQII